MLSYVVYFAFGIGLVIIYWQYMKDDDDDDDHRPPGGLCGV